MLGISSLEKLVHEISRLPGIGPKTAQRLAYYILKSGKDYSARLVDAIEQVNALVHECPNCFNFTDLDVCKFCSDAHRNDHILCVVEEPSDIVRIEASGAFKGRYHVLHGAISPLEGIGPQQLKIQELLDRVDRGINHEGPAVHEIIMALDADLEGDTTVLYLSKLLSQKQLRVSRIAHGVPIGSDIDFIDDRTMGRALENRVEV